MNDKNLEQLGRLADKADNFAFSANLPMPPNLTIEGMKGGLEEISTELKRIYRETTGEDPWKE